MRWESYLAFAEAVLESEWHSKQREAASRAAVSRAYYAIFNCARQRLLGEGLSLPENGSVHGEVMRAFEQREDPASRQIGLILRELRDERRRADYDDFAVLTLDAPVIVERARECMKILDRLPTLP